MQHEGVLNSDVDRARGGLINYLSISPYTL